MAFINSKVASIVLLDHDNERVQTSFPLLNAATQTQIDALFDAINPLVNGTVIIKDTVARAAEDAPVAPVSAFAQTDIRWRLVYTDDVTGRQYTLTLGTANLGLGMPVGSEYVDMTQAQWAAFKAAFDAVVKSPEGNPATLVQAYYDKV